jgi:hypothetical protein
MLDFYLGLDLAQSTDFSALAGVRRHEDYLGVTSYDLVMLERWRGESYARVPGRLRAAELALQRMASQVMFEQTGHGLPLEQVANLTLAVDGTGVGRAVLDILDDAGICSTPIVIHGGQNVGRGERGAWHVPKKDLIFVVQVLLQGRRLRIAEGLPEAQTLVRELSAFRYVISAGGHTRYEAGANDLADLQWRTQPNDDLVLAVACALWLAERRDTGSSLTEIAAAWYAPPND